jgi:hypothetical protein
MEAPKRDVQNSSRAFSRVVRVGTPILASLLCVPWPSECGDGTSDKVVESDTRLALDVRFGLLAALWLVYERSSLADRIIPSGIDASQQCAEELSHLIPIAQSVCLSMATMIGHRAKRSRRPFPPEGSAPGDSLNNTELSAEATRCKKFQLFN